MVYRATALRGLANAQMVFGALMFVFGIASFFFTTDWTTYVGFGIWVGVWVFITGILGYVGARDGFYPDRCLIGCFMGFSIIGCILSGQMAICYSITLLVYAEVKTHCNNYNDYGYDTNEVSYDCYGRYGLRRATAENLAGFGSCLLILSLVELVLALASSIYCCKAVCCNSVAVGNTTRTSQQEVYVQPRYMNPRTQPGGVLMQTEDGVVPQGYPATGQQPAYVLLQLGVVAQPEVIVQPGVVAQPRVVSRPRMEFKRPNYRAT